MRVPSLFRSHSVTGTTHRRLELNEDEVIQSVTEAVVHLDLPSVDAINTYIVSRAVAQEGVKVALSGLGGDELFGGYPSFRDVPRLKWLAQFPRGFRRLLGGARLMDLPNDTDAGVLTRWRRRFFTDEMLQRAGLPNDGLTFECPVELPDDFARISWAELTGYLPRHAPARFRSNEYGSLTPNYACRFSIINWSSIHSASLPPRNSATAR